MHEGDCVDVHVRESFCEQVCVDGCLGEMIKMRVRVHICASMCAYRYERFVLER